MVVRASKFRHVHGSAGKDRYDNINSTPSSADSNIVAGNTRFFALPWNAGGGPFVVHNLANLGRLETIPHMFNGHSSNIQDLDFSPFDDCVIASASEDASLKVWNFSPFVDDQGLNLTANVPDSATVTLTGHTKKVTLARWNPVASDVLLSVSYDSTVRVWDVTQAKEASCIDGHGDTIQHVAWSYNGSVYATTCRDKQVRLCDPRQNKIATQFAGHEGSKGARVTFLGNRQEFATVGFSRQSDRQLWFWDPRDTSKPVHEITIDQASGAILPFFDVDTSLLYLGGKGDCNIRYYEVVDGPVMAHYIDQFSAKEPQRGCCLLPKMACDFGSAEVARVLRLGNGYVEPVSFVVPRKSDAFADDLYPPTFAGKPSLSASEWTSGKDADPLVVELGPGGATGHAAPPKPAAATENALAKSAPAPAPATPKENNAPAPAPAPAPASPAKAPPSPTHAAPPAAPASPKPPATAAPATPGGSGTAATRAGSSSVPGSAATFMVSAVDASGIRMTGTLSVAIPSADERVAALQARVLELEEENAKLRAQLGK